MADPNVRAVLPCPQCGKVRQVTYRTMEQAVAARCRSCGKRRHGQAHGKLYYVWHNMKVRCSEKGSAARNNRCYRALGITVSPEWTRFDEFYEWAQQSGYREGLQIDRIDGTKGYGPSNCRWVTPAGNSQNRRTTKLNYEIVLEIKRRLSAGEGQTAVGRDFGLPQPRMQQIVNGRVWAEVPWPESGPPPIRKNAKRMVEVDGVVKSVREWSRLSGRPHMTIWQMLARGVPPKEAVFGKHERPKRAPIFLDNSIRTA